MTTTRNASLTRILLQTKLKHTVVVSFRAELELCLSLTLYSSLKAWEKQMTELEIFLVFQKCKLKNRGGVLWQKTVKTLLCCMWIKSESIFLSVEAELSDITSENPCVQLKSGEVKKP